ncbi:MAG: membrane protein insertase YidC [Fusobacterium sp.]|nr:membrane protein insertase YidC [Fusobacterium sp.]
MKYIYGLLIKFIEFLLKTVDSHVGNFGLSIIIVTIIIKILLLPLTLKQDKSMKAMKKLQPQLEEIKKKYANDKQMMNIKTMELYKENKVNPAGGCLPILIQLPILFALFGVLRSGIIPADSTFLWMKLSKPDPFYVLPVLNGAVSFLQQKLMGTSDNPQMKNMMYMFPIMMIFISYKMPAGLQIYWLTSSLAAVIQQYFIMKKGA